MENSGQFEKGCIPHNKGKPITEWMSKEGIESFFDSRKVHPENLGRHAKKGNISHNKGKKFTKEYRKKFEPYWKSLVGRKLSKSTIEKVGRASKKSWQNPEVRDRQIKAILKGLIKRPTSLEKQMIEIIRKNNLPYKYTGDGSFLIGFKNPDFVNCNGEKICIEVANTYHHSDNYEKERIEHFKKYGWKCIVFRTNKLEEEIIMKKIRGESHD